MFSVQNSKCPRRFSETDHDCLYTRSTRSYQVVGVFFFFSRKSILFDCWTSLWWILPMKKNDKTVCTIIKSSFRRYNLFIYGSCSCWQGLLILSNCKSALWLSLFLKQCNCSYAQNNCIDHSLTSLSYTLIFDVNIHETHTENGLIKV